MNPGRASLWVLCAAALTLTLTACGPAGPPGPPPPPAAAGTAEANCTQRFLWRYGPTVRVTKVSIFEGQRGVIRGSRLGGTTFQCFTDTQGEVVHVIVDRPRRRWG